MFFARISIFAVLAACYCGCAVFDETPEEAQRRHERTLQRERARKEADLSMLPGLNDVERAELRRTSTPRSAGKDVFTFSTDNPKRDPAVLKELPPEAQEAINKGVKQQKQLDQAGDHWVYGL